MCKIIGIDVSKQTFDVSFESDGSLRHQVFNNNLKGYKKFIKKIETVSFDAVGMEFSGVYYLPLASYLYTQGVQVYVVNPLSVKRYSQMKFYRAKTDKKDAGVIKAYVESEHSSLTLWEPESQAVLELKQLYTTLELLHKQLRQSKNQRSAFESSGITNKQVHKSLHKMIKAQKQEIKVIEQQMLAICLEHYQERYQLLQSIPSIGAKTAMMLITITDDFKKFNHYKKLIAYVGMSPRIYQSGTSVKAKGHICKMGKSQMRKLLYMCSWSAKRYNKTCIEMSERLQEKGKPNKVINVAIANKLLKQAFAVATSKQMYNENYQTKVCF